MRITFAPYTDDNDALNLPGYVYVNVKPQTWIAGKNSTSNPARIVPLEVQDAARENMQQQQKQLKLSLRTALLDNCKVKYGSYQ
jgi:restriction endonuclease Mrr